MVKIDLEIYANFQRRADNLKPESSYAAWLSLLENLTNIVRGMSLETGSSETEERRNERRVKINEARENLMGLLLDPDALAREHYSEWREQERMKQMEAENKRKAEIANYE